MKIILIGTNSEKQNGASQSLVVLARKLRERNGEILVVLPQRGPIEELLIDSNIQYKVIRYSNTVWFNYCGKRIKSWKNIVRILMNIIAKYRMKNLFKKYDIVHINALTSGLPAEAISNNNILVWHMREFMEEDLDIEFSKPDRFKELAKKADCFIAVSESVREKYDRLYGCKIEVIYNGVETDNYYIKRKENILSGDKIKVVMSGRISEQKGQDILLKALKVIKEKGSDKFQAVIVGGGERAYIQMLKQYCMDNVLDVVFLPFSDNIKEVYSSADIVCVNSFKEAFGRVTVEAMMSGALVIGAKSGGTVEIIKDNEEGCLVEVNDVESLASKLIEVSEDRERYRGIAKNGQRYALNNFTADINADKILGLYQKLREGRNNENRNRNSSL